MALTFKQTKGKAVTNKVETYEYKEGENTVRLIGGILPRYIYWIKGTNNKDIPVECLAFSRDKEKFDNVEKDHVPEYYPDLKCSWSYSINCIDPKDGRVKALNLKKKLFEQILTAAEDLGYKHLDLTYYPDLNKTAIKYNPIITIENNKIYFKYEE